MPIVAAVGIFLWPGRRKGNSKHNKSFEQESRSDGCASRAVYIVGLVMMSLAILRYISVDEKLNQQSASIPFEQNVELIGMVVTSSEASSNGSQFIVKGSFGKDKEKIKYIVRESEGKEYAYGEIITIAGKIEKPEPFETESGGMFDYPNYLKKDSILGIVKAKTITKTDTKGNPILRVLYKFNNKLEDIVKTTIPGMKGSLASGVLLGDKQITKENREEFVTTGTTHIIALSGYNVSIVANFFRELFSFLPLAGSLAMGGLSILLFVTMTGLQSSAVRAGIMASIVLFAKSKGRNANIGTVILMAGFVMTAINPYTLYRDVSAQLSFLATVGIIYFSPTVAHWFKKVPEKWLGIPWREMITGTIGTQIFVLPFILWKTGVLSIVSPITNILILPFVPYLMAFTSVVAILGFIYLPIALPFALIANFFGSAILFIIHISTLVPLAAVTVKLPFVGMSLTYAFLLYYFDPFGWRKREI